jgi:hypothetical protein
MINKSIISTMILFLLIASKLLAQEDDYDFKIKERKISKMTYTFYDFPKDINNKKVTYSFTNHYNTDGLLTKTTYKLKPNEYTIISYDSLKREVSRVSYENRKAVDKILYVYQEGFDDYFQLRVNSKLKWDTLVHQRSIIEKGIVESMITFKGRDTTNINEYAYIKGSKESYDSTMTYIFLGGEKVLKETNRYFYKDDKVERVEFIKNGDFSISKFFRGYDDNGNLLYRKIYYDGILTYEFLFKYDKNGILTEKIEHKKNQESTLMTFTIDEKYK